MICGAPALHYVEHGGRQTGQYLFIGINSWLGFDQRNVEPVVAALLIQHRDRLWNVFNPVQRTGNVLKTAKRFSVAEQNLMIAARNASRYFHVYSSLDAISAIGAQEYFDRHLGS